MHHLKLHGIDGRHLWGFLTAIGTLALLDEHPRVEALDAPRLVFDEDGTAVLHSPVPEAQLPEILLGGLRKLQPSLEKDLRAVRAPKDLDRATYVAIATAPTSPRTLDLLAGLACVVGDANVESTLCAANGAGHQYLVQSMRDILHLVEVEHLKRALFAPWEKTYEVPEDKRRQLGLGNRKPTLRLDPSDERLYALRLSNPTTTNDFRTELGAQALAIPAFALLPVVPRRQPVTIASTKEGQRATFSWPLWNVPATLPTVRTLLWTGTGDRASLRSRGVFAAFSADRVSGAKGKLSFAPSQGVW